MPPYLRNLIQTKDLVLDYFYLPHLYAKKTETCLYGGGIFKKWNNILSDVPKLNHTKIKSISPFINITATK